MPTIETILIMVFLILLSNIIFKFTKKISVTLIQIFLGALYGLLPVGGSLTMETDIFLLIFIAPILFMDGRRFKNRELIDFKKPILYMVLGLVFLNVVLCGFLIYFIIDGIPLPLAFAFAAVLSPTDAVAVKSIAGSVKLPRNVNTIIEGESMFNDASGLVAFNFAIVAQLTGVFSIGDIAAGFIYISVGGLLLGVIAALVISLATTQFKKIGITEPNFYTLVQMLTPFVVFLLAEHIGLSGILAVVACGMAMTVLAPKLMTVSEANIRFTSEGAWSTFLFTLNGLVFVFLGMELPETGRELPDLQELEAALPIFPWVAE